MENWVRSAKKVFVQPVIAFSTGLLFHLLLTGRGAKQSSVRELTYQCSKCLQPNHPKAVKPVDSDNGQRSRERLQLLFSAPHRMP
jgi:hypothetical protein